MKKYATLTNWVRPSILAMLCAAFLTLPAFAQQKSSFSNTQQKEIKEMIRSYLLKNPELIREALVELERRQVAAQRDQQSKALAKYADELYRSKYDYVAGNPNGDVTVVEFFDYNCGFCKRAISHVMKLIENDKNVRVVFKEFPIFGEQSEQAARFALASIKQNKYVEMHQALLEAPGRANAGKALRLAKKYGLDVKKLQEDMKAPEVSKAISSVRTLANAIGLQGTPFYLVGDEFINGAPEDLYDQLRAKVALIRKNGCKKPVAC